MTDTEQTETGTVINGALLIALERQRQIDVEGWNPDHDDQWQHGEILQAAQTYGAAGEFTSPGSEISMERIRSWAVNSTWPWSPQWWKPSADPIRNLVKAGALIAAEIDRLQRVNKQGRDAQ